MNIFDVIVNEHIGKDDRHVFHKILEGQYFLNQKLDKIMNQLDLLKNAIAEQKIDIAELVVAYQDLVTKFNNLPVDDSDALAALTADVNATSASILGALHPVVTPPVTTDPAPPVDTTPPVTTEPPVDATPVVDPTAGTVQG